MTDDQLRDLLRSVADNQHFEPGFSARVSARLETARRDNLSGALVRHSARLIPAVLAASIALVAWNYTAVASTATVDTTNTLLTNAEVFE